MPKIDISQDIGADKAALAELESLLLSYFHHAISPTEGYKTIYGEDHDPKLELTVSKKSGNLTGLHPLAGFHAQDKEELKGLIRAHLLTPGPTMVGRSVLYSGQPTSGYYRYRDAFQLVPVPPEAPRPPYAVGDHPLNLEVAFSSSSDSTINFIRRDRRTREIELLCSLLLWPTPMPETEMTAFHWVYEPAGEGEIRSAFRQGGYTWPGAQGMSDGFSSISAIPMMAERPFQEYYAQNSVSMSTPLQIPDSLTGSLDTAFALPATEYAAFMRSCYWYQRALKCWNISRSLYFVALVSAVEALMPDPERGEKCATCGLTKSVGPTQHFKRYVDRLAPGAQDSDRKRLYSLRSAITHGGKLLHADESIFGISTHQTEESQSLHALAPVVRTLLLNWLHIPSLR